MSSQRHADCGLDGLSKRMTCKLHLHPVRRSLGVSSRRGIGRQAQLAAFNLIGFWGIGVPVGYWLCFHVGWGLRGLWTGILAGVCVTR